MNSSLIAKGIGLDLPVYRQTKNSRRQATLGVLLRAAFNPPHREVRTLLDDININLKSGDRLAIVGRNGSGKSTLLKILVGAYKPTRGSLDVVGRRQALLNLSLGFNQEATLVENIILRGIAIGLKPKEAAKIIDRVLDFAELEVKAGDRLRTLSSGQRMRLGFAIATEVNHEILIMDEWVGTGDAAFVEKAKERLNSKVNESEIVVLATHNLKLAQTVCNHGMMLDRGGVKSQGDVVEVMQYFSEFLHAAVDHDDSNQLI